jgi:hypothetical protein
MLRHKAMVQCARLAFGYAGIYDADEADRIRDITPEFTERPAIVMPEAIEEACADQPVEA